jgi:pimeloyl-ACP methyl ester carboxylesterase
MIIARSASRWLDLGRLAIKISFSFSAGLRTIVATGLPIGIALCKPSARYFTMCFSLTTLAEIRVPLRSPKARHDKFIKLGHAKYLAQSITGAEFILLPGVSHFAPLQRPELFNGAILAFLRQLAGREIQS